MSDQIAEAITAHWGERCADYAEGCPCCDAWKQYDDLATPKPDELRQAMADAWDEGYRRGGDDVLCRGYAPNPYAAPDEGGGK